MITQDILESQRNFFNSGETIGLNFRIEQLKKLKKMILTHEKEILQAVYADLRKPDFENQLTETQFVLMEINHTLSHLKYWVKPEYVETPLFHKPGYSFIKAEPLGVSLIIAPWNYPFQLLIAPLVASIAAGNCAILKPSELSPNTSKMIAGLIKQTFDPNYIAVIEGGVNETTELLNLKFDYIFYTGSTSVGKIVMSAAAKHLTPVTLELGGKSPCVVDKNVPLKQTARKIIWGKFLNSGQTCIAPDYVLVDKSIKEKLIEVLKETISEFYGDTVQKSENYARIINERHFNRLMSLMVSGEIVAGGESDKNDLFITPTIIVKPDLKSELMTEEIFGPILPIIEFSDKSEAISFIKARSKPLALYVFSKNNRFIQSVLDQTSSGGVCVNDTLSHITTSSLPFGGVGDSGMGQYHGKKGFDSFSHQKSVLKKSFLMDYSMRYPPYPKLSKFLKRMINMVSQ